MVHAVQQRRPVFTFASGRQGLAYSGVWFLWTARRQPDLYIAIKKLGGIKGSIHGPRPPKYLGWRRHFGFGYDAKGNVAAAAIRSGGRHKAVWHGRQFPDGVTLEWRVLIRGSSLRTQPISVDSSVILLPVPHDLELLEVMIFLGPPEWVDNPFGPHMIGEGRLLNEWRYCVGYVVQAFDPTRVVSTTLSGRGHGDLANAPIELRAVGVDPQQDGSLAFWDARVINKRSALM
jgi:hypothetical protein